MHTPRHIYSAQILTEYHVLTVRDVFVYKNTKHMSGVQNINYTWMEIMHPCAKSLRNPCGKMISWALVHFACVVQVRSWFRTWDSWLLRFSASRLVRWFSLSHFLACPVASRLLGSTQRSFNYLRDFGLARSLREACEKFVRLWRDSISQLINSTES